MKKLFSGNSVLYLWRGLLPVPSLGLSLSLSFCLLITSFAPSFVNGASLVKKWDSGKVFSTPESVIYDAERHVLLVSSLGGPPDEKNGGGFISRLSMKGQLLELKWIDGFNAPKGMGIWENTLYVADITDLVEVNIEKGKIVRRYPLEGAVFLNDVAIDDEGRVYVSDSALSSNAIYRLSGGKAELWVKDDRLGRVNGLFFDGDRIIAGVSADAMLRGVDPGDRSIGDVAVIGSAIDGIAMDSNGDFIVSDWKGRTVLVDSDGGIRVLADTRESEVNAADICFIEKYRMLLIPTFYDDRVIACTLVD
ncbi:MAG: SMP-30/gluconolactonase/LRE family protein [Candidatus Krumholzibacteria bacterium]|nr:SMP-30/gluconolactonase/LRE family protein [Candidatus Krumholzibacteria bacterium]